MENGQYTVIPQCYNSQSSVCTGTSLLVLAVWVLAFSVRDSPQLRQLCVFFFLGVFFFARLFTGSEGNEIRVVADVCRSGISSLEVSSFASNDYPTEVWLSLFAHK